MIPIETHPSHDLIRFVVVVGSRLARKLGAPRPVPLCEIVEEDTFVSVVEPMGWRRWRGREIEKGEGIDRGCVGKLESGDGRGHVGGGNFVFGPSGASGDHQGAQCTITGPHGGARSAGGRYLS